MIYAYHLTGFDFNAFKPLIETMFLNGDLQPNSVAIAYSKEDPATKDLYVASTVPLLKDADGIKTLNEHEFENLCRIVADGNAYATWGHVELFRGSSPDQPTMK